MFTPSWAVLRLDVMFNTKLDVIFVFHGDINDETKYSPSEGPVCIHLGNGFRSWRGDEDPRVEQNDYARRAVRAYQPEETWYPPFLAVPHLPQLHPSFWATWRNWFGVVFNFEYDRLTWIIGWLNLLTQIVISLTVLMVATNLLLPGFKPELRASYSNLAIPSWRSGGAVSGKAPVMSESDAAPVIPESGPYTLVRAMPVSRELRDLTTKHHKVLRDNWAFLHGRFVQETEAIANQLSSLVTPTMRLTRLQSLNNVGVDEPEVLNILDLLRATGETFSQEAETQARWNSEVLSKWVSLAAWWSWDEPGFTPWRYLPAAIPAKSADMALHLFTTAVVPRNARARGLVDEFVCSGTGGLLPWPGMRAHYAAARDRLFALRRLLVALETSLRDASGERARYTSLDPVLRTGIKVVGTARDAADVALEAARDIVQGLDALCANTTFAAELGWRVDARENSGLVKQYLSDDPEPAARGRWWRRWGWGWWRKQKREALQETSDGLVVARNGQEVAGIWLSFAPYDEAVDDLTATARVVWESRYDRT
ncbi:hypothetical protein F4781DRAFT_135770 [Annulohypoxylon bovei var. microspora]|nr:hypothetical protein F4781DRAFT_135770 [Annulohypoxylon bovei var. microspora]